MNEATDAQLRTIQDDKLLVLFDGHCNLCNGAVQFVIKRDSRDAFRFAALSWQVGEALAAKFPELKDVDSIVLYDGNEIRTRSSAALKIASKLGGLWPLTGVFWVVPKFIRDAVYNWVARNRYSWFGQKESCMMPTPETKRKFLEQS